MPGRPRVLVIGASRALAQALASPAILQIFAVTARASLRGLDAGEAGAARPSDPHVIVLDLPVFDDDSGAAVERLVRDFPEVPLLVSVGKATDKEVLRALRAGACGCLFHADLQRRLLPAIHDALEGGAPMSRAVAQMVLDRARRHSSAQMKAVRLTPPPEIGVRKREILELFSRGLSYEQIGSSLGISVNTVRSHVREIYSLLGASTKVEAVMAAVARGILDR